MTGTAGARLGFLGPAGTYSEEAALAYDRDAERVMYPTIGQVASAVDDGQIERGIVPIENSLQGAIPEVLDFLIHTARTRIVDELALQIRNCLVVKPGVDPTTVQEIYSHPQPLGQCRGYLARRFPAVRLHASLSTASAVTDMLSSPGPAAAIAPRRAAELYRAQVIEEDIQDNPSNFTRFVVLAHADHPRTGKDKTSIALAFDDDRPGLLYEVMGVFAQRKINLNKIESRPTGEKLGRYVFLIDLEGHRTDAVIAAALDKVRGLTSMLKVFGSYPASISSSLPRR